MKITSQFAERYLNLEVFKALVRLGNLGHLDHSEVKELVFEWLCFSFIPL